MPPNATENLLPEVVRVTIEKAAPVVEYGDNDEGTTKCDRKELGYGAGDAIFASFVVAPQVVSVWRGTWNIMESKQELFPFAQSYILGIVIHVCFALIRSQLLSCWKDASRVKCKAGRWLYGRILSRVYTYVFILSCIMHWRGGWGLLDQLVTTVTPDGDPHRPYVLAALTATFYLSIAALRSSRNILASPYFLVTDGKEATYIFTTRFEKKLVLLVYSFYLVQF